MSIANLLLIKIKKNLNRKRTEILGILKADQKRKKLSVKIKNLYQKLPKQISDKKIILIII